jgi:hypothetical protein
VSYSKSHSPIEKDGNSINTLKLQSNYFLFQSIKAGFEMKQFHHRNSKGKLNEMSSNHLKPIDIYIFKKTIHLQGSSIQAVLQHGPTYFSLGIVQKIIPCLAEKTAAECISENNHCTV